jgi:hypothetical protein
MFIRFQKLQQEFSNSMVLALYKHHKQTQANNVAVVMFFNANMSYTIKPKQT